MEMTSYEPGTPSWVDLGTPDPAAAADFYGSLFGWTSEEGPPEAGGYRMCTLRGKAVAGLGPQQNPGMPPYWTTYVTVADADATAATVAGAGGTVLAPAFDVLDAGRMAVFADRAGAVFSIWEPRASIGAELVNETGTFCWNELHTRDTGAAAAFYGTVFGWGANAVDMAPGMQYTEWKLGDRTIAGMMPMGPDSPDQVPPSWLVYFAVDDCDASAAQVSELGGSLPQPPMDIPVGRFAVCQDPQGATFGIIRFTEPAA